MCRNRLGRLGREILSTLGRLDQADVAAICDVYPPYLRRSARHAPDAKQTEDYKTILSDKSITAVIIATPSHLHTDIAIEALQAGKHVYCEAPLAISVDDAKKIALAAKKAWPRQLFQPGLQLRSDSERLFLLPFIQSGALGKPALVRGQWHKKQQWRGNSPNPEQAKALNWRLYEETSIGLAGEMGVHQMDQVSWYMNALPVSATGFGTIALWDDGRTIPDTIQAVIEYPNGLRMIYDATLANSFESVSETYYGSYGAILMRDDKAWMFKEVDSPNFGWEVYARKDKFYDETGIALVADATKLTARNKSDKPVPETPSNSPLHSALGAFLRNSHEVGTAVQDFISLYGDDDADAMKDVVSKVHLLPSANYLEGYRATVVAAKVHEAIKTGKRVDFKPEWFELG